MRQYLNLFWFVSFQSIWKSSNKNITIETTIEEAAKDFNLVIQNQIIVNCIKFSEISEIIYKKMIIMNWWKSSLNYFSTGNEIMNKFFKFPFG